MAIYVTVNGGVVQGVHTDDPRLLVDSFDSPSELEYVIIDYDTDGADEGHVMPVVQQDGTTMPALIGTGLVDLLEVKLPAMSAPEH